ncbi:response regulator [Methylobacterium sp. Leaf118]|uniref:response regulator n=1 Tax=Methylobacterium sp. Leaf118 TaxID=2876562 RepID=UPI001E3580BF|nr:response regulator [Methylobacterium sp. Leaf118]
MTDVKARRPVVAIVDDDPAIRAALDRLTRALGYEALVFDGAAPLLAKLNEADIAFVVTDVQMPGLSGLDLLRILGGQRPHLPVMVMTAYPSEAARERALALGAFAYCAKPFEADQFERCLTSVLGARPYSC